MNFAFFESLTDEQAEECLHEFLREGEDALPVLIAEALADGIAADLSVESVPRMIGVVERRVTTQALDPDPDLPAWIRESETYEENLFDFSDESFERARGGAGRSELESTHRAVTVTPVPAGRGERSGERTVSVCWSRLGRLSGWCWCSSLVTQ